jgi:hypothetical protein
MRRDDRMVIEPLTDSAEGKIGGFGVLDARLIFAPPCRHRQSRHRKVLGGVQRVASFYPYLRVSDLCSPRLYAIQVCRTAGHWRLSGLVQRSTRLSLACIYERSEGVGQGV